MQLTSGHSYLFKRYGNISKVTVLQVTNGAYNLKFENASSNQWYTKEDFAYDFTFVEDLGMEMLTAFDNKDLAVTRYPFDKGYIL